MAEPSIDQLLEEAMALHQSGRVEQAEAVYRRVLRANPDEADALHLLGVLEFQTRRSKAAIEHIRRAIELDSSVAEYHFNLALTLESSGKSRDEAAAAFRKALELKPDFPQAYNALATIVASGGDNEQAIQLLRRAIELQPDYVESYNNLGNALQQVGQPDAAIEAYRRAISLRPNHAATYGNLAGALEAKGNVQETIAARRKVVELNPEYPDGYKNLITALVNDRQISEGEAVARSALMSYPNLTEVYLQLGNILQATGRVKEAYPHMDLACQMRPEDPAAQSNRLGTSYFHPDFDAAKILEIHLQWSRQFAQPLRNLIQPHANDRDPERRLRIGYVSPDFRKHCQVSFMAPLLAAHDRKQFEIFCYANVHGPDIATDGIRRMADAWRDIVKLSDDEVAQLIREDEIDILVDLTMHMVFNRILIFARKPAPVQVTWLAYPGTTGLETIDYRLTDPYLDPPGSHDMSYSETSIRLPDTFWCYDPMVTGLRVNDLPAKEPGKITFGCLNSYFKMNDRTLDLWRGVFAALPQSRLMLLAPPGSHRQAVLQSLGLSEDRVTFTPFAPREEYFRLYHQIDLGLDTFPYNGHTTSLDSFYMGVPVVSLCGETAVSRAGFSQTTNLGLADQLVAHTPEEFVKLAVDLANDPPRLRGLRSTLRQRMQSSPLMNSVRFARNIESSYRTMWRQWCRSGS